MLARIVALEVTDPTVELLADGSVLVVGAWCVLRATRPERNALRITANGDVVERATVGDGVAPVRGTPGGKTWVGYHDTGVYGNNDWSRSDQSYRDGPPTRPIGTWGLVHFDASFTVEWEFGRDWYQAVLVGAKMKRTHIVDVSALNVIDETAWVYF